MPTFLDEDTDDAIRVKDKVGALGVLVTDNGRAGLELLRLGEEDHLLGGLVCLYWCHDKQGVRRARKKKGMCEWKSGVGSGIVNWFCSHRCCFFLLSVSRSYAFFQTPFTTFLKKMEGTHG
jgi:hypothetical protein